MGQYVVDVASFEELALPVLRNVSAPFLSWEPAGPVHCGAAVHWSTVFVVFFFPGGQVVSHSR